MKEALAFCAMLALATVPNESVRASLATLGLAYDTGWSHDENSGNGYSYFSGTAFVDCAHTRVGARQSADLFTGGYAHALAGSVTSYADMGVLLENDEVGRGRVAVPNKVQLYGQASTSAGPALLRFADGPAAPQHRLDGACDTSLQLKFFVASAREIDVRYTGTFVSKRGGAPFRATVTAKIVGFVPADGWSPRCARCAVRRVETLAVGNGLPTRAVRMRSVRSLRRRATSSTRPRMRARSRAERRRCSSEARERRTNGSVSTNAGRRASHPRPCERRAAP